jgi:predicted nucleotidyltransferase
MTRLPIEFSEEKLDDVCRKHHIRRLRVFGSALRDDFGPASDIDVLVEFAPGAVVGFAIVDVENDLAEVFGGRKIDLVNPKYISRFIRDEVLTSAEEIYAA